MSVRQTSGQRAKPQAHGAKLRCPECGSQGVERESYYLGSTEMVPITGLDLGGCDGCRRVLAAYGAAPIGVRPKH
jgi:hypothetical protein